MVRLPPFRGQFFYGTDGQNNITITQYDGGFVYENNSLKFFSHPEGYVNCENNTFTYVYQYKDHLGNIRLSYKGTHGNLSIEEQNDYYPFGMKHGIPNEVVNSTNIALKYKYNDKELQDELGLNTTAMDYRQYDQALGRFNAMDRLSELAPHMTSYRFAFNNPVYWSDPSGLYEVDKNGNIKITDEDEIKNFLGYLKNNKGASVQKMSDEIFYSGNYAYELQEVVVTVRSSSSYNKAAQNIFNQIQGAQSKMANFNGYVTHTGSGALDNFSRFNDGFGGAMTGLGYSSASYRLTNGSLNGSSISPKVYSSGWKGGSRAGITTYGVSNTAK